MIPLPGLAGGFGDHPLRPAWPMGAGMLVCAACASGGGDVNPAPVAGTASASSPTCDVASATPWITRWFDAWLLVSEQLLRIPDAPAPDFVFFDASCVYTTSPASAAGPAVPGPGLRGEELPWRSEEHHDTLTLPNSERAPVALMSFANVVEETGKPFFVMAAPEYWAAQGIEGRFALTPVFLHEFAHTRQVRGMDPVLGPIDDAWDFPEALDDDVVQSRFGSDSAYAAAYLAERDLLYRAANAESTGEARVLAEQALAMIRSRQARWFVGENAVFSTLDDIWLSMEGAGQWAAYAWLAHPSGGGMQPAAAVERMIGSRRRWTQDEGLALFLVVDRLLPDWPPLVFEGTFMGAADLLEAAIGG